MVKRLLLLLVGFCLINTLLLTPNAKGADISPSISVSPAKTELRVTPGQTSKTVIRLENRSTAVLPFRAVAMDFAPKDKRGGVTYDQAIPGRSAKDWFRIETSEIVIPPQESRQAEVTIRPPELVEKGSYFAIVMFQAQFPSNYFDETAQARIVPWVGSLFLLSVGSPSELIDESLTISGLETPRLTFGPKLPVKVEVTNNTPFHLSPQTEFGLNGLTGKVEKTVTQETIMPGYSRVFEGELNTASKLGAYRPEATVMVGSWRKSLAAQTLFILSWQRLLIIGLALGAVLGLIRFRRRFFLAVKYFHNS